MYFGIENVKNIFGHKFTQMDVKYIFKKLCSVKNNSLLSCFYESDIFMAVSL